MNHKEFRRVCSVCTRCPLHRDSKQVVVDRGDPTSPLMIVGEAPGRQEDKKGVPFVGPSGRRLGTLLKEAGLSFDKALTTNVIRCRPKNNDFPRGKWARRTVDKCLYWLDLQMKIVDPKLVILTGAKALDYVIQRHFDMSKPVGEFVNKVLLAPTVYPNVKRFYVIYHPAYLLRRKSKRLDEWTIETLRHAASDLERLQNGEDLPFLGDAIELRPKVKPPETHQYDLFLDD